MDVARTSDPIALGVERALTLGERFVLAVSGGVDSMVLLDAFAAQRRSDRAVTVAWFDHGTGPHTASALRVVRQAARRAGFLLETGRAHTAGHTEAQWRLARWEFLRDVAGRRQARVVTGHTRDDHIETVIMRMLRGAGARGLAGMLAPSATIRPLLDVTRVQVVEWARRRGVSWVEDPGNASRRHVRNRVRCDLMPALTQVSPGLADELLAISRRAAVLRRTADDLARACAIGVARHAAELPVSALLATDDGGRALLWQSVMGLAGVVLDRRGTSRLLWLSTDRRVGARIQLSGGFEAVRRRESIVVRRSSAAGQPSTTDRDMEESIAMALSSVPGWRFEVSNVESLDVTNPTDLWTLSLNADARPTVRPWRSGDRMLVDSMGRKRRVKRFFADRRIVGPERQGWPVVILNGEIVWIPGVRRGPAATVRSGGPVVRYVCERTSR